MGKFFYDMFAGPDNKPSSGKFNKAVALLFGLVFCFIQVGIEKDISYIVTSLFIFAGASEVANRLGNAINNKTGLLNDNVLNDKQGK